MVAAVKITRMDHTAVDLRGLAAKSNDAAQVRRLLALALILEGQSRHTAATLSGMDRQTLRDWVHRYNTEGVSGLLSIRSGGHPASLSAAQMAERSNHLAGGLAGVETILVVEDQAFVRDVTCEVLRSAGYSVLEARHSTEAARAYDHHFREVDLLVTDIVLPGEDGRALTERLRRKNPSLRVLLISGYPEQMAAREKGSEEYLAKPFSTAALLQRVREVLGRGPLGTEGRRMNRETRAGSSGAD